MFTPDEQKELERLEYRHVGDRSSTQDSDRFRLLRLLNGMSRDIQSLEERLRFLEPNE